MCVLTHVDWHFEITTHEYDLCSDAKAMGRDFCGTFTGFQTQSKRIVRCDLCKQTRFWKHVFEGKIGARATVQTENRSWARTYLSTIGC
jgi:hypothetical protein